MIHYCVFSKYRRVEIMLAKLKFIESARLLFFSLSVLSFTVGMGATSMVFLGSAIAQIPLTPNSAPLGETKNSQANVLFVNPSAGGDKAGNGSDPLL